MTKYDAIIIGGGHNGLTSAAYLAKAGKKVLVLERRHLVGGAAVAFAALAASHWLCKRVHVERPSALAAPAAGAELAESAQASI